VYNASVNNVNILTDLLTPAPTTAIDILILVSSGVRIGSVDVAIPSMDLSGLPVGSTVFLRNQGEIHGKGGDGGRGRDGPGFNACGGGGGGAGTNVGIGGGATAPATVGANGTFDTGGAAGVNATTGFPPFTAGTAPEDGGIALTTGAVATNIDNINGELWGGGGGGGGGFESTEPGVGGPTASIGGLGGVNPGFGSQPGNAVSGTAVTFLTGGFSPDTKGVVG